MNKDVRSKVLLVTYHFPPSAASGTHRLLGLSQFLPEYGWEVAVVSPSNLPWEVRDDRLLDRVPEGTAVYRTEYPSGWLSKPIRKVFPYGAWLPRALSSFRKAMKNCRPDAVLTSGPPHCVHLAGLLAKRMYGLPWIADFRDPWVTGNFLGLRGWNKRCGSLLERQVFAAADAIVLNAPNAKDVIDQRFPEFAHKTHCVTNGFDPAQFANIDRSRSSDTFTITHAGELYAGRDPRPFLEALKLLFAESPHLRLQVVVQFVGSCNQRGLDLPAEIRQRELSDVVSMMGPVSHQESLERMVKSDALLLIDSPDRTLGIPAKLYEYLGAERPVLAMGCSQSDVEWVLKVTEGRHYLVDPADIAGTKAAIRDAFLRKDNPQVCNSASMFSRSMVASNMAGVLNVCLGRSKRFSANQSQHAEVATS